MTITLSEMFCRRPQFKKLDDNRSTEIDGEEKDLHDDISTTSPIFLNADAENDERALEWWRSHQQGSDIGRSNDSSRNDEQESNVPKVDTVGNEIHNETLLKDTQISTAQSLYATSHPDFLTKPHNGMVLDPSMLQEGTNIETTNENPSLGIFATKSTSDLDDGKNRVEYFQPVLVPTSRSWQPDWRSYSPRGQSIAEREKKNASVRPLKTDNLRKEKSDGPSSPQRWKVQDATHDETTKSLSSSKYIAFENNAFEHSSNYPNPAKSSKLSRSKLGDEKAVDNNLSDNAKRSPRDKTNGLVRFDGWLFQNSTEYQFSILNANEDNLGPRVFTPGMMEALRSFMPTRVMNHNFWLRFSLVRDGAYFSSLLKSIRASTFTMIGVETENGEVFGSFTGSPWKIGSNWYGSSEAFLWRLKQTRYTSPKNSRKPDFEREIEVYPCTGDDDLIQFCTNKTIAVGGGEWQRSSCPYGNTTEGIGLVIDGDLFGGETNSCQTFANPKLARHTSPSSEFVISNLEVWSLTPCIDIQTATEKEMREFHVR